MHNERCMSGSEGGHGKPTAVTPHGAHGPPNPPEYCPVSSFKAGDGERSGVLASYFSLRDVVGEIAHALGRHGRQARSRRPGRARFPSWQKKIGTPRPRRFHPTLVPASHARRRTACQSPGEKDEDLTPRFTDEKRRGAQVLEIPSDRDPDRGTPRDRHPGGRPPWREPPNGLQQASKDNLDLATFRSGGQPMNDTELMRLAMVEAERAAAVGEVPVGAVVALGDEVIGTGRNQRETLADPTAHAEILALREASRHQGTWHLDDAVLCVTLEPCPMCAGALVNARVSRLVYGCADPKAGAVHTLYEICTDPRLNHRLTVVPGVLEQECGMLLTNFFARIRAGDRPPKPRPG